HHRYMCRRALRHMEVKRCGHPQDYLDDWVRVYGYLVAKHGIEGMRAFSRRSLSLQLDVPGASFFVAVHAGRVIGALLVYQQGDVAYAQLTGVDDVGYELGASYALFYTAMQYCSEKVFWFNLSGVPGVSDTGGEGLRWFKQGWSRETRVVYFCGRVFDQTAYDALCEARGGVTSGYFPAYRAGEFG
ncbi:MAG: GNAT family N-acetyltransferase, partial [Phycisphaerales bacterium]